MAEDLGPKALQIRSLDPERSQERRQTQLAKKEALIGQTKDEIAENQGQVVQLQAEVDDIASKIRDIDFGWAEIQSRFNQLTAKRAQRSFGADDGPTATASIVGAAECLTHTLNALRYFEHLDPAGQQMLRTFMQYIEQLRSREAERMATDTKHSPWNGSRR